jgi:hypothetical protein
VKIKIDILGLTPRSWSTRRLVASSRLPSGISYFEGASSSSASACRRSSARDLAAAAESRQVGAAGVWDVTSEHEKTIAQGIERGVTQALHAAGLDSEIHELNRALLIALDDPDAAAKWSRGEKLFSAPES